MDALVTLLIIAPAVAATAVVACHLLRRRSLWLDAPTARSSHVRPTSRAGGVAIVASVLLGAGLLFATDAYTIRALPFDRSVGLAVGLVLLMAIVDDMSGLRAATKLAVQVAAGAVAVGSWTYLESSPTDRTTWLLASAAFLWLLTMTNAFNFMDGIDGLAGGQAVVGGIALAAVAWQVGAPEVAAASAIVAAGMAGFLVFNLPPARLFMGDTGSQTIGFVLGLLGLMLIQVDPVLALAVPVLFFSFLWDTGLTLFRRMARGKRLFGHRAHLHQLMHQLGASHGQVCRRYYLFAILQAAAAFLLAIGDGNTRFALLPLVLVVQIAHAADVLSKARRLEDSQPQPG